VQDSAVGAKCLLSCRVAASGSFLFETRLGCLQPVVPRRTCQFVDAMHRMMDSSLPLIVADRLHRALNTSYWRRHEHAWHQLFTVGNSAEFSWPPYIIGQAVIFLLCGFFFLLSSSVFFSSPNLSSQRLDVYHTSIHDVSLVRN